jgi:hypothetical protein
MRDHFPTRTAGVGGCAVAIALALLFPAAARAEKPPTYFGERYEEGLAAARSYAGSYYEGILITGTPAFVGRARAALALIESKDSRSWLFTRKHVRRITLNGHAGMDIGGGRITADDEPGEQPEAFAGRIVHEAWHGELALSGDVRSAEEAEAFCLAHQNEFLVRAGFPGIDVARTLASRYWEKDYWSRDW